MHGKVLTYMKTIEVVRYPIEYFRAQLEFIKRITEVSNISFKDAALRYTDVYGGLTSHTYGHPHENQWVFEIIQKFDAITSDLSDLSTTTKEVYKLYLSTNLAKIQVNFPPVPDKEQFGCFRIGFEEWHVQNKQVRLHFSPLRQGLFAKDPKMQVGDLAKVYMPKRQEEFAQMIAYIKKTKKFLVADTFVSKSWLQNIPAYQSFMPPEYRAGSKYYHLEHDGFLWLWGQFIHWDFTGNTQRLAKLQENLAHAKTLTQVLDSIPLHGIEIKVPIEKMFEYYKIQA